MMTYEFVYVHIYYACGCEVIRPVLVAHVGSREKRSPFRCQHCQEWIERRYEIKREREAEVAR